MASPRADFPATYPAAREVCVGRREASLAGGGPPKPTGASGRIARPAPRRSCRQPERKIQRPIAPPAGAHARALEPHLPRGMAGRRGGVLAACGRTRGHDIGGISASSLAPPTAATTIGGQARDTLASSLAPPQGAQRRPWADLDSGSEGRAAPGVSVRAP